MQGGARALAAGQLPQRRWGVAGRRQHGLAPSEGLCASSKMGASGSITGQGYERFCRLKWSGILKRHAT
jgi:hypothetical protein